MQRKPETITALLVAADTSPLVGLPPIDSAVLSILTNPVALEFTINAACACAPPLRDLMVRVRLPSAPPGLTASGKPKSKRVRPQEWPSDIPYESWSYWRDACVLKYVMPRNYHHYTHDPLTVLDVLAADSMDLCHAVATSCPDATLLTVTILGMLSIEISEYPDNLRAAIIYDLRPSDLVDSSRLFGGALAYSTFLRDALLDGAWAPIAVRAIGDSIKSTPAADWWQKDRALNALDGFTAALGADKEELLGDAYVELLGPRALSHIVGATHQGRAAHPEGPLVYKIASTVLNRVGLPEITPDFLQCIITVPENIGETGVYEDALLRVASALDTESLGRALNIAQHYPVVQPETSSIMWYNRALNHRVYMALYSMAENPCLREPITTTHSLLFFMRGDLQGLEIVQDPGRLPLLLRLYNYAKRGDLLKSLPLRASTRKTPKPIDELPESVAEDLGIISKWTGTPPEAVADLFQKGYDTSGGGDWMIREGRGRSRVNRTSPWGWW